MQTDWTAVDWGTTHLRAWAMGPDGRVLAQYSSDKGMGVLDRDGFEPALLELVGDWLGDGPTDVVACGMVGARQGWVEANYTPVPAKVSATGLTLAPTSHPKLRVHIQPGMSQSSPADVMRGEETQIAGYLATRPTFDGVLCLPGTHSKWAQISAEEVVSFRSFMTGELFSLMSRQSVLRHGMGTGWDEKAFDAAVDEVLSKPEMFAARLFAIRAEGLLHDLPPDAARSRLSGYLIGAEIAATKPYWLGQPVVLIGDAGLSALYTRALKAQGAECRLENAETMTLAGLKAARAAMKGTAS